MKTSKQNQTCRSIVEERITDNEGNVQSIKYAIGKYLGKGGFAKVYVITNIDNDQQSAVKVIQKSSLVKKKHKIKLLQEIKIHRSLSHEHIVKFQKVFEDKKNVYILLELCTNNTLKELVKARGYLTEFEVRYYIHQILLALKNLRDNLILHRDIKPGNVFLNDQLQVKIGDFGLASKLAHKNDKRKTICGTPNYLAPEFLEGNNEHGFKADVWSLGVLAYTISIGKAPFATTEVKKTYKRIKKGHFVFPDKPKLSEELRSFISSALTKDPDKRPSITKILKHEFFKQNIIPPHMHLKTLQEKPTKDIMKSLLGRSQITLNRSNISQNRNIKTPKKKNNLKKSKVSPHRKINKDDEVHVVKFSDYSQKYGIGYLLSNGCSGVYFNDGTKIIFEPKLQYFQYLEKKEPTNSKGKLYKLKSYPEFLQKKVTLLMHFRSYLENLKPQQVNPSPRAKILDSNIYKSQIYLKKWMNTKHAHLFRLSNKMVQTIFEDKSQILLSSETKTVVFINKKSEKFTYEISKAQDSGNQEMSRRLKYTKEILTQLLSRHSKVQLIKLILFNIYQINFLYCFQHMQNKYEKLYRQSKQVDQYGGIYSLKENLIKGKKKFMEQQLEELKMKLNEPDKKQLEEERKLIREKRTDKVKFMKEKTQIFLSNMRIQEKNQQIKELQDYIQKEEQNLENRQLQLKQTQDKLKNDLENCKQELKNTKQVQNQLATEKNNIQKQFQQLQNNVYQKEIDIRRQKTQLKKLQKLKQFVEQIYQMYNKDFDIEQFISLQKCKQTLQFNQQKKFFLTQNIDRKFNQLKDPVEEFQKMMKTIEENNLNYIHTLQNNEMDYQQAETKYQKQKQDIENQYNTFDKNIDKLLQDEKLLDQQIEKKKALLQSICLDDQLLNENMSEEQLDENDHIEFLLQIFQSINFQIDKNQNIEQLLQVLQVNFQKLTQNCDLIQQNMPNFYNKQLKEYLQKNKKENRLAIIDQQKTRIRRSDKDIRQRLQQAYDQKQQRTVMKKFIIKKSNKKNSKKKSNEDELEDLKYFTE